MDFTTRLKTIMEQSQLSASDFAASIEVQASSISHIISGRNKASLDFLMKIKDRYPQYEWEWLIKGQGPMLNPEHAPKDVLPQQMAFGSFSEDSPSQNLNFENHVRSEDRPYYDYGKPKTSLPIPSPSPSGPNGKISKIIIFYENGKFETFEP
jgi:transcriptional regulator with XRE-family HTH domain